MVVSDGYPERRFSPDPLVPVVSDDSPGRCLGSSFEGGLQSHLSISQFEVTGMGLLDMPYSSL